jgi:hypothetical protein
MNMPDCADLWRYVGHPRRRQWVSALLTAVFLLQPLLTFWVAPMFTHDVRDNLVVVCTLQGAKLVELDAPRHEEGADTFDCPALKLFQIASSATGNQSVSIPTMALYAVSAPGAPTPSQQHAHLFRPYSTRAPPITV